MPQDIDSYMGAVLACIAAAKVLEQYDLDELLQNIERAYTTGPILDPTLWREKHKALAEDREVLEAALPLWRLGRKLREAP